MSKIHRKTLQSLEYDEVINYIATLCLSETGREKVLNIKPFANLLQAEDALKLYQETENWLASASANHFVFSSFPNVSNLFDLVEKHMSLPASNRKMRFDLDAYWLLREMLKLSRQAYDSICDPNFISSWPSLLAIARSQPLPLQLTAALMRCISDDGLFRDESSPELFRLRTQIRNLHQSCLRKVKDFALQYNMVQYLQDDFMTLSSDRYVLPLKANFKGRMQGIIHDWSQTGETYYFEPIFLVEINNRLQELKHEEKQEEQKILEYLGGLFQDEYLGVKAAFDLLGILDFLNAKIKFAREIDAICPTFTPDDQGIELLRARHPLLALAKLKDVNKSDIEKRQSARPLDIILRPGERVMIVTGGNAGGKTVCLKTLGLITILAMSGIPVPVAAGSHLPWFERIDAFIGDEQSIDDNVSTFTAQIDHLAKAWKYLDNHGLVLLDEFGAGTDPAEGSALAQAVLDELLKRKCFVLSATHFPALKSYALTKNGVRAASMLFNPTTNKPLFKLAYDQVGASQALVVAEERGLPQEILVLARHYLLQDGNDSTKLLSRLNALAAQREKEIESLQQERLKYREIIQEKRIKLEKEQKRLHDEVRDNISKLMYAWKEGKLEAKQAMKEMSRLRTSIIPISRDDKKSATLQEKNEATLEIGLKVFHMGFNKHGIVKDVDKRKQRAKIDLNGVSLWASFSDLKIDGQEFKNTKDSATISLVGDMLSTDIDVRGMRTDEALASTARFIDQAVPSGFSEVEIIHGRGSGVLRREIHNFLRTFPAVKSFTLAPEDRGGDGMTIVELK